MLNRICLFIITFAFLSITHNPATIAQADQPAPDYPVITPYNIIQIKQLKVFGEGLIRDVIFSPDEQYVAMSSSVGIWLYAVDDLTTPIRLFGNYAIDVTHALFNADSTRLYGGIYGGSVYVWDVAGGELLYELHLSENRHNINELRLSDDEQNLYVISSYLDVWNLNTHQPEQTLDLNAFSDNKPVLSPDEKYTLMHRNGGEYYYDKENFDFVSSTTIVFSVETGLPLYEIREEGLYLYNPQFDETSSKIVGILDYANWAIGIWDVQSGDLLHIIGDDRMGYKENLTYVKPHEQSFSSLARAILSKDQSKAIFFHQSGAVSVWDIATNTELREYAFSINEIANEHSSFKPYETIRFNNPANEEIIRAFIEEEEILYKTPFHFEGSGFESSIVISPNRTFFVSQTNGYIPLYVWRIETGELVFRIAVDENCYVGNAGIYGFSQLSLQNSRIVHYIGNNVCIWDVETEQLISKIPTYRQFQGINPYTLDTQHFVTINTSQLESHYSNKILIWDLETNTKIQVESNLSGYFDIATFSHDGDYLSAVIGGYIYVWDTKTGEKINQADVREIEFPESLVFSPDNEFIAIEGAKNIIGVYDILIYWDYKNGIKQIVPDVSYIVDLKFSPNGDYILTSTYTSVALWDSKTGELIYELYKRSNSPMAIFSPDGSYFAISHNNGFDIIETETGEMLYSFGIGDISWLDFSPSDEMLMVVQDKTIQFWDVFTMENLYTIQTPSIINSAKFNEDGNLIITEMRDGTIRLWGVPTP